MRPSTPRMVAVRALLCCLPLAGCGGGGGGGGSTLPPVLSVTPVDLSGPFNPVTQTFGSLRFESPVLVPFGEDLGSTQSPAIEYITTPSASVRACAAGQVEAVELNNGQGDYEVRVRSPAGSSWLVIYDHVRNVTVAVGEAVAAGDALGISGTWSGSAGRTELQVNDESRGVAVCPLGLGTAAFQAAHEAARAAVSASAFGPLPSLCTADTVVP